MPRKQKPILFQTEMVQAILVGIKTQTRRLVNPNFDIPIHGEDPTIETDYSKGYRITYASVELDSCFLSRLFPYGNVGDVLWVRESWNVVNDHKGKFSHYRYKADSDPLHNGLKWKPSIHMPKAAARIFLEITDIRVERLNDISEEDALAEGVLEFEDGTFKNYFTQKGLRAADGVECLLAKGSFQSLIASINGKEIIDKNPWVWVIKFKVLSTNGYPFNPIVDSPGGTVDSTQDLTRQIAP